MPLPPNFVRIRALADHHKEAGYHKISEYMDDNMATEFSPQLSLIFEITTLMGNDEDAVVATVGNLAIVALCDYMERFETERLEKEES